MRYSILNTIQKGNMHVLPCALRSRLPVFTDQVLGDSLPLLTPRTNGKRVWCQTRLRLKHAITDHVSCVLRGVTMFVGDAGNL